MPTTAPMHKISTKLAAILCLLIMPTMYSALDTDVEGTVVERLVAASAAREGSESLVA
jgi:hypothetical protein